MDELLAEGATVASLYYFPWWACHGSVPNQLPRPIKSLLGGRNQREKKYQREREKKKKKKFGARPVMGARLFPSPSPSKESDPCIMRALMGRPCIPHIIPLWPTSPLDLLSPLLLLPLLLPTTVLDDDSKSPEDGLSWRLFTISDSPPCLCPLCLTLVVCGWS